MLVIEGHQERRPAWGTLPSGVHCSRLVDSSEYLCG